MRPIQVAQNREMTYIALPANHEYALGAFTMEILRFTETDGFGI